MCVFIFIHQHNPRKAIQSNLSLSSVAAITSVVVSNFFAISKQQGVVNLESLVGKKAN